MKLFINNTDTYHCVPNELSVMAILNGMFSNKQGLNVDTETGYYIVVMGITKDI